MRFTASLVAIVFASLAGACAHASTHAVSRAATAPLDYRSIVPEVSVSRSAEPYREPQTKVAADADVMAEILAIPPGH